MLMKTFWILAIQKGTPSHIWVLQVSQMMSQSYRKEALQLMRLFRRNRLMKNQLKTLIRNLRMINQFNHAVSPGKGEIPSDLDQDISTWQNLHGDHQYQIGKRRYMALLHCQRIFRRIAVWGNKKHLRYTEVFFTCSYLKWCHCPAWENMCRVEISMVCMFIFVTFRIVHSVLSIRHLSTKINLINIHIKIFSKRVWRYPHMRMWKF